MSPPGPPPSSSVHEAVYYEDPADLAAEVGPLLDEALRRGDDVALACREASNAALLEALGEDERVVVVPRSAIYRKAVSAVAYVRDLIDEHLAAGTRRVCLVGEVGFETDGRGLEDWRRYEAVLNHALNGFPVRAMCAYSTQLLPDPVLTAAELTHPYLRRDGIRLPNPGFIDPAEVMRSVDARAERAPDGEPDATIPQVLDLEDLHQQLSGLLAGAGMERERREDVILAVHELVANGLRHGAPPVAVRVWTTPDHLACAVTDHGPGFDDPFAGYVRGDGEQLPEGRLGLWMARQLCDEVVAAPTPEGFTVNLSLRY